MYRTWETYFREIDNREEATRENTNVAEAIYMTGETQFPRLSDSHI